MEVSVRMHTFTEDIFIGISDFQTKEVEMWIQNDVSFVKTMATEIYTELVHNSTSTTLVGNPGIGKTSLMRHIALQLVDIGYDIVPIHQKQFMHHSPINSFPLTTQRLTS